MPIGLNKSRFVFHFNEFTELIALLIIFRKRNQQKNRFMNVLKPLLIALTIAFTLPSCFLFRSKHESCPAYGQDIKQENDKNINLKTEKSTIIQKA